MFFCRLSGKRGLEFFLFSDKEGMKGIFLFVVCFLFVPVVNILRGIQYKLTGISPIINDVYVPVKR